MLAGRHKRATAELLSGSEPAVLEARGICHEYRRGPVRRRTLEDVNLAVAPGELTLLMGPSGSGKTTLLSILGCILAPTAGTIHLAGEPTQSLSPEQLADLRRRHIGFVFQNFNLISTLTAEENVRVALDIRGVKGAEARAAARATLQMVGLIGKAASLPAMLSGGEQQRVAVARAVVNGPAVILADEPTASLDNANGMVVMDLLKQLAVNSARAVLAVTHDQRTIPFADRVLLIEDGRIIQERRKPGGVVSLNDIAWSRSQKALRKPEPVKPCETAPSETGERQHNIEMISGALIKYNPTCKPPFTVADVVTARFAQRMSGIGAHASSAREDMLCIVAEWDNPDDALTSQSDTCLSILADLFQE
ncbi:MAG: ABC transporter ATP-binding protein [Hyphomicrobiales bacterium]|nr:MAG: ABC transporter ATP-binding protein [Hyphomicrobiales bacterium]